MGLRHPSIAPYGVFTSKDGKDILISIQSEREWKTLCAKVLDQPDLPDRSARRQHGRARAQPRFHRHDGRGYLRQDDARRAVEAAVDADIAFAEVNTMADLTNHPHLRRIEVDTPKGRVSYPAPAPIIVGETRAYGAVPAIGENPSKKS